MSDTRRYWDVRIGWRDSRGYCDTSRHIGFEDCGNAMRAIALCKEWSTGCPTDHEIVSISVTLKEC